MLALLLPDGGVPQQQGCAQCLPGQGRVDEGIDTGSGVTSCTDCAPGMVSLGIAECQNCSAGRVANVENTACEMCPGGKQPSGWVCEQCSVGGYSTKHGVCHSCEAGSVPENTQSQCQACEAGKQPNANWSACDACPPGRGSLPHELEYHRCSPGEHSSVHGTLACEPCGEGQVTNLEQTGCLCGPGYFSPELYPGLRETWQSEWCSAPCVECSDLLGSDADLAVCPGGGLVFPSRGQWVGNFTSAQLMYACVAAEICGGFADAGSSARCRDNPTQCCALNHEGPLCGKCSSAAFMKGSDQHCVRCDETDWAFVAMLFAGYGLVGLFLDFKARQIDVQKDGAAVGIIIFFAQSVALFADRSGNNSWYGISYLYNMLDIVNLGPLILRTKRNGEYLCRVRLGLRVPLLLDLRVPRYLLFCSIVVNILQERQITAAAKTTTTGASLQGVA